MTMRDAVLFHTPFRCTGLLMHVQQTSAKVNLAQINLSEFLVKVCRQSLTNLNYNTGSKFKLQLQDFHVYLNPTFDGK